MGIKNETWQRDMSFMFLFYITNLYIRLPKTDSQRLNNLFGFRISNQYIIYYRITVNRDQAGASGVLLSRIIQFPEWHMTFKKRAIK